MAKITSAVTLMGTILALLVFCQSGYALTSLAALPKRAQTFIKLNDGRSTLIQEKRVLSLKKGDNQIRFSWQNVMISPESIRLEPISNPEDVTVLRAGFPLGEALLLWDIHSKRSFEIEVLITYLLADLDGLSVYTASTDPLETHITLNKYMVLRNFSGEAFQNALFSLNGSEPVLASIRPDETKRLLIMEQEQIPVTKRRVWNGLKIDPVRQPEGPAPGIPVTYEFTNTRESNLGLTPIFQGKTRIFQTDKTRKSTFIGEDNLPFTPVGDTARLRVGDSRDVLITRRILENQKTNVKKNRKGRIQVFDQDMVINFTAENFKKEPALVTIIETIIGEWVPVKFPMEFKRLDHETIEFQMNLAGGEKKELTFEYRLKNIFPGAFARFNTPSR